MGFTLNVQQNNYKYKTWLIVNFFIFKILDESIITPVVIADTVFYIRMYHLSLLNRLYEKLEDMEF